VPVGGGQCFSFPFTLEFSRCRRDAATVEAGAVEPTQGKAIKDVSAAPAVSLQYHHSRAFVLGDLLGPLRIRSEPDSSQMYQVLSTVSYEVVDKNHKIF
jgi:hypothetical protein